MLLIHIILFNDFTKCDIITNWSLLAFERRPAREAAGDARTYETRRRDHMKNNRKRNAIRLLALLLMTAMLLSGCTINNNGQEEKTELPATDEIVDITTDEPSGTDEGGATPGEKRNCPTGHRK